MSDLFNNKSNDPATPAAPEQTDLPDTSYFDALVGDGKKFSSSEALARGKYESDLYVTQLQAENSGMRAQITESESVSELLDKAFEAQAVPQEPTIPVGESDPAATGITQEEVQKLVEAQVNSRLNAQEKMDNIQACHTAAEAAYGTDYVRVLTDKAQALGLGQEFLKGIAADQPAAFLKLMVDEKTAEASEPLVTLPAAIPQGAETTVPAPLGAKNHKYYNALKVKDKVHYWSTAVQNEIYAAAKAQGPAFYE